MVTVPLSEIKDFHRNKRAMLQRLAKRCQSCQSVLHHVVYEYMIATERWIKEMGEKYDTENEGSVESGSELADTQ